MPDLSEAGRSPITLDDRLARALTHALEQHPSPVIPAGFAARTAQRAASQPVLPGRAPSNFGAWTLRFALAVLLAAMLLLAHSASLVTEYALAGEFLALSLWIILKPGLTS